MTHEEWIPIDKDAMLPPALAALGFHVRPNVHLLPDAPTQRAHKEVTWMVKPLTADGQDARALIPAWRSKSIFRDSPGHPLIAAMLALQTRQVLAYWQKGLMEMPHVVMVPGCKLARAVPPTEKSRASDISPHLRAGGYEVMMLDHAAAAITVGHGVFEMMPNGCKVSGYGAAGEIPPASMLAGAAAQIEADPARCSITQLPGYGPGEHPFLYALAAIRQSRALAQWAEKADPTLHLNSRVSEKVALVSQSIMESSHKFKEHVHHHIRS